jgi:hypothetical protein
MQPGPQIHHPDIRTLFIRHLPIHNVRSEDIDGAKLFAMQSKRPTAKKRKSTPRSRLGTNSALALGTFPLLILGVELLPQRSNILFRVVLLGYQVLQPLVFCLELVYPSL